MDFINACKNNDLEKVKEFIEEGMDMDFIDSFSNSGLHYAAEKGYFELVEMLVINGADVNTMNNKNRKNSIIMRDYTKENFINTPLHKAFLYNNYDIAFYLISKGAKIKVKDQLASEPFAYARKLPKKKQVSQRRKVSVKRST